MILWGFKNAYCLALRARNKSFQRVLSQWKINKMKRYFVSSKLTYFLLILIIFVCKKYKNTCRYYYFKTRMRSLHNFARCRFLLRRNIWTQIRYRLWKAIKFSEPWTYFYWTWHIENKMALVWKMTYEYYF